MPGEIDDPSLAAAVVNYTEKTLGFTPAYWEIGNEPELWRYWKVPWSSWNVPPQNGSAIITPGEYAWMVHNYTAVLRTADPNLRILGIAGTGRPQPPVLTPLSAWINATVAVNGANLSGIAFHVYTAGVYGAHTLGQFYAFDTGPYSVFGRVSDARSSISNEINATCPGCPTPPVFLTELGSALSHFFFANLSRGFAGGLSMAASEAEGMDLDLPTLDVFASVFNTSNAWFALNGTPRPDFAVYAQFLSGLGSDVFPATLTPPSGPPYTGMNTSLGANLYAVATEDPSDHGRSDLLLVNQNTTTNVSLAPALPGISATPRVLLREWSARAVYGPLNSTWWVAPLTAAPVVSVLPGGLPSSWTLPPQTIAEFESYPSAGAGVSFNETGLPSAERWYLSLNGRTEETPGTNLTVILPTGTASVAPIALPLPFGSFRPNPLERMEPFPPSSVTVGSTTQDFLVPFATQWNISTSVGPPGSGWTTPPVGWANASSVVTLDEVPASGFVPGGWTGVGTGSYTGLSSQATLVVKGAIQETALFLHGFPVTVSETGLATGTPWSLSIGGATSSSTSSSLVVLEANGTFALQVGTPTGYTLSSAPSTLTVNGGPVSVSIVFAPVVATYSVRWQSVGLPGGATWFLLLNGARWNASVGTVVAALANGSYAAWVSNAGDF
ncbi:MAG: hypothetical protein KGI98_17405, partial [Euryarchaeota archaeon]|nr:hypothetical protein [Euryarchaeota archaeon]